MSTGGLSDGVLRVLRRDLDELYERHGLEGDDVKRSVDRLIETVQDNGGRSLAVIFDFAPDDTHDVRWYWAHGGNIEREPWVEVDVRNGHLRIDTRTPMRQLDDDRRLKPERHYVGRDGQAWCRPPGMMQLDLPRLFVPDTRLVTHLGGTARHELTKIYGMPNHYLGFHLEI